MAKKEKEDVKESLVTCDALDERDFLRKKIISDIKTAHFIGSKRIKDKSVDSRWSKEEFEKAAESSYSRIMDLIDRYQRLDAAITLANATEEIETKSGRKMTRAAAIALRKQLAGTSAKDCDFIGCLIDTLTSQLNAANLAVAKMNNVADAQLDTYVNNLTSNDSNRKLSEEELSLLDGMVADLYGEFVDPIKVQDKLDKLQSDYDSLCKELDSAIKISNASTTVEF